MKSPARGEVWIVDLGLVGKVRPAVVMSVPLTDDDRALLTVVPHTTSTRGSRFEVLTKVSFLKEGAFDAQNLVTIPLAKLERHIGSLSTETFSAVEVAVRRWLGWA